MWKLDEHLATFDLPGITGRLNFKKPSLGITLRSTETDTPQNCFVAQTLQLSPLKESSDCACLNWHVRGADLVAQYQDWPSSNVRWQVYWRLMSSKLMSGVEAIVAVQTSDLDSHPTMGVLSRCPASHLQDCFNDRRTTSAMLRFAMSPMTYLEVMPVSSVTGPSVSNELVDEELITNIRWRLLDERMEKGVIRVSRVLGVCLIPEPGAANKDRRIVEQQIAEEVYGDYLRSEPPLTA